MKQAASGTFLAPIMATMMAMAPFGCAAAAESGGGFTGPDNVRPVTVAEAGSLPDDTDVRMEGHLVRALGDEDYEFDDGTGTMTVEIDDDEWQGVEAGPDTRVVLQGELDTEQNGMQLDVDRVRVVGE